MQVLPTEYTLNNGLKMPAIGLGSASHKDKESLIRAIMQAGYTHIDTASLYGNEDIIGEALQECFAQGKKREDLFITTKIWHSEYNDVQGAIKQSLAKLQLDYVDLYLVHWPLGYYANPQKPLHVLWPEMEALVD